MTTTLEGLKQRAARAGIDPDKLALAIKVLGLEATSIALGNIEQRTSHQQKATKPLAPRIDPFWGTKIED